MSKKKISQRANPQRKLPDTVPSYNSIPDSNPGSYYNLHPSWKFSAIDDICWTISRDNALDDFWNIILPKLIGFESQTWAEILVNSKKQNHSIDVFKLNSIAQSRLSAKYIEAESIISLRLDGTHRLYGYFVGTDFFILWYDKNHGDNSTCVCKSTLKYT